MTSHDAKDRESGRSVWRLVSGAAAIVVAVTGVTVAATYVAGTENTDQVAADAVTYGAAESLLAGATATHARLSEAITATAALPPGEVDQDRLQSARSALTEVAERTVAFAADPGVASSSMAEAFVDAAAQTIESLEAGEVPAQSRVSELDAGYAGLVGEVVEVRRAAAARIATARSQAGALTTAARSFVVVVVPVLALTGVYRSLRHRQRRRELEVRLESETHFRIDKDRLIASVGHELRTPLTGVLGLAEALREGRRAFSSGERNRMIETIADQAQELSHRIDDLVTVSRVDSELLTIRAERVDVRAVIDEVTFGWEARHRARLTVVGRGTVRADPRHVKHVIRNLLTCATRAAGEETEIRIHPGNVLLNIEVRDDGVALDESGERATTESDSSPVAGLGLSMAAARRLAEHMGGTLERYRRDGVNVSLLRLPRAPVVADDVDLAGDLVLDPSRTRPTRQDIRAASDEAPPTMVYEPIVSLVSSDLGSIVGFEALARFPFGTPETWFREATEVGLGVDLELKAIEQAIAGFEPASDAHFLAVNVSDRALVSVGLVAALDGMDPTRVVLELSEDAAIASYEATGQAVEALQQLGYRLALDNIGQGETDLWHILRMRPSIIKLDGSIVRDLHRVVELRAMVAGIVAFGDRLATQVIAEGIENATQVALLQEMGVTIGQGYLFGGRIASVPAGSPAGAVGTTKAGGVVVRMPRRPGAGGASP